MPKRRLPPPCLPPHRLRLAGRLAQGLGIERRLMEAAQYLVAQVRLSAATEPARPAGQRD